MSDLTTIAENIRTAMDAMDKVQDAEEVLRLRTSRENYKIFREQMEVLTDHLNKLRHMLAHENEVALDELGDAMSRAFYGHVAEYRHADGHGN